MSKTRFNWSVDTAIIEQAKLLAIVNKRTVSNYLEYLIALEMDKARKNGTIPSERKA